MYKIISLGLPLGTFPPPCLKLLFTTALKLCCVYPIKNVTQMLHVLSEGLSRNHHLIFARAFFLGDCFLNRSLSGGTWEENAAWRYKLLWCTGSWGSEQTSGAASFGDRLQLWGLTQHPQCKKTQELSDVRGEVMQSWLHSPFQGFVYPIMDLFPWNFLFIFLGCLGTSLKNLGVCVAAHCTNL